MKKLYALILLVFISICSASAQQTAAVENSDLMGIALPSGANKIAPDEVPAEVGQALDKIIAAGNGKLRKGDTEMLAWDGRNYKKSNAPTIIEGLTASLRADGWQFSVEAEDAGVTTFTVVKKGANPRALVGFYAANNDALVFVSMEVFRNDETADLRTETDAETNNNIARNSVKSGSIVGTWTNGSVSTLSEKNLSTGEISSRGGSTFKYVFNSDGTFSFVGLMNSTVYGCTTSLFNDKRGKYEISGDQLTLRPSKNFWRNQYSCSPASNKERDYVLTAETFSFRTKVDEYGKTLVCLNDGKSESCYRKGE